MTNVHMRYHVVLLRKHSKMKIYNSFTDNNILLSYHHNAILLILGVFCIHNQTIRVKRMKKQTPLNQTKIISTSGTFRMLQCSGNSQRSAIFKFQPALYLR